VRSKRCILSRVSRVAFLLAPMQLACIGRLRRTAYFRARLFRSGPEALRNYRQRASVVQAAFNFGIASVRHSRAGDK
jgi:hypothetical protein